ncbi:TPA: cell surface composition regulator GlgS [Pluralibacter gergoviae]|nr:cell surface composition regulator GlgS [Pluralibacter gergoviae]HDS1154174.1 cell surface composition regulator GlgS [Pluralibacter gergoviae]
MLMDNSIYSLKNFDFLARTFAIMQVEGHPVDINAVTGNMDDEHRRCFCERYAYYCQKEHEEKTLILS